MDDSMLYTGVDQDPGMFQNEIKDEAVSEKIQEQERLIKELTPKLQDLLNIIDAEIKAVDTISDFMNATDKPEADIRSELKSRALYKAYLSTLKTKFTLAMNEVK